MKALSFKEPYASLMLHGKIETRTWKTKYRGPVLICSSKKAYTTREVGSISGNLIRKIDIILDTIGYSYGILKTFGLAISVGELIDCRPMTPDDEDRCFVKYKEGLWCHVYSNVKPIKPIPWKGSQGFRNVPENVIDQIEYLDDDYQGKRPDQVTSSYKSFAIAILLALLATLFLTILDGCKAADQHRMNVEYYYNRPIPVTNLDLTNHER